MGMQFMSLGSQEELRNQIIELAFDRTFLQQPLPVNAEEFNLRKEQGRTRLNLLANEIARLVGTVLAEYAGLPKKLQGIKSPATTDMQNQLQALIGKRFIVETPYAQLVHYPRYLKAITVRMEKMRADPTRDTRLMQDWNLAAAEWQRTSSQAKNSDIKLQEYRWMLEELRVSLFAQELKTPMPVSAKRLQRVWESLQR
jgi:ATP-dependent helicase HrpA